MGRDAYNQGKNAQFDMSVSDNGIAQTCIAKGPGAVAYGLGIQSSSGIGSCMEDKSPSLIIGDNPGYQNGVAHPCNWDGTDVSPTLTKNNAGGSQRMPDKDNFNCVLQSGVCLDTFSCNSTEDIAGTLKARDYKDPQLVCKESDTCAYDLYNQTETGDKTKPLTNSATDSDHIPVCRTNYIVRRLTPLECERLQGYPDGWTDIGEWTDAKGKKHETTDSARYKALGNSIALPQWRYVLGNICKEIGHEATMASLFDGIGGFPLIWEDINGKGSCLWASEIEEFPIAVTERRINNDI